MSRVQDSLESHIPSSNLTWCSGKSLVFMLLIIPIGYMMLHVPSSPEFSQYHLICWETSHPLEQLTIALNPKIIALSCPFRKEKSPPYRMFRFRVVKHPQTWLHFWHPAISFQVQPSFVHVSWFNGNTASGWIQRQCPYGQQRWGGLVTWHHLKPTTIL